MKRIRKVQGQLNREKDPKLIRDQILSCMGTTIAKIGEYNYLPSDEDLRRIAKLINSSPNLQQLTLNLGPEPQGFREIQF